jgi:hypothetical protein
MAKITTSELWQDDGSLVNLRTARNVELQAQTLYGGTGSYGDFSLGSTSHANKGKILFGTSGYSESVNYLGIGTQVPSFPIHVYEGGILVGNAPVTTSGMYSKSLNMNVATTTNYSQGLNVFKSGKLGGTANDAILFGAELGYHNFYGYDGTAWGRGAYALTQARENFAVGAHGSAYKIATTSLGTASESVRLYIDASGFVGIGASQPAAMFHVNAAVTDYNAMTINSAITASSAATYGLMVNSALTTSSSASGSAGIFVAPIFYNSISAATLYAMRMLVQIGYLSGSTNINSLVAGHFQGSISGSYTGIVSNYMGVYIANTSFALQSGVAGCTSMYGMRVDSFTNGNGATSGTSYNFPIYIFGPTAAAGSGGLVRNYSLTVNLGTGDSTGTNNYGILIQGNGGTSYATNYALYSTSTANSRFSGNLGIGTSPSYLLHVYASQDSNATLFQMINASSGSSAGSRAWLRTDGGDDPVYLLSLSTSLYWSLGIDNSDSDKFKISNAAAPGSSDYFTITTGGNVGIAATSPDAPLEVETSVTVGQQAVTIDQKDADQAFLDYQGTSAADAANNISSWTAGNTIQGFVKIEVNGTAYWMPYYNAPTS